MKRLIYDDGEQVLLKKEDLEDFLDYSIEQIENDIEEEELEYYKKENKAMLEQVEHLGNRELICLRLNAMNGWFVIDQTRVNDILDILEGK